MTTASYTRSAGRPTAPSPVSSGLPVSCSCRAPRAEAASEASHYPARCQRPARVEGRGEAPICRGREGAKGDKGSSGAEWPAGLGQASWPQMVLPLGT